MSIEWLLTKTKDIEAQKRSFKKTHKESGLSDKGNSSKPGEPNQGKMNSENESQLRDGYLPSPKVKKRQFELDLRCECGYEGTVIQNNMDTNLPEKQKKGFVYFECPSCKRHLQYDCLTGKIKTKKGIWGVLLGKFS